MLRQPLRMLLDRWLFLPYRYQMQLLWCTCRPSMCNLHERHNLLLHLSVLRALPLHIILLLLHLPSQVVVVLPVDASLPSQADLLVLLLRKLLLVVLLELFDFPVRILLQLGEGFLVPLEGLSSRN